MKTKIVIGGIIVLAVLALGFLYVTRLMVERRLYLDAEPVADLLHSVFRRTQDRSRDGVRAVLTNDEFGLLNSYEIEYPNDTNVILWVTVNHRLTVGLGANGVVQWRVNK